MKKILLKAFVFFITLWTGNSQTFTFDPASFNEDEEVTLTVSNFNPLTQWGVSDIYIWAWHFDANGNQINNPPAVGNDFGNSPESAKFTRLNETTFAYTFTPTDFFNNTGISRIGYLIKSQDGSNQTSDNFVDVGRVIVSINSPSSDFVVINSGESINLSAIISYQGSVTTQGTFEVFFDDVPVANGTCGFPNCSTTLNNITQSGTVKVVGTPPGGVTETGEDSFEVRIAPTVVEETLPPNLVDGINYTSNTSATLVLTAPSKDFVEVAGNFNNYSPDESYVMKRDPSTGKYWLAINGLTPGTNYTYQYWVYDLNPIANSPAIVKTADPFSTLVLSPFDDPGIPSETYPNLPTYPNGQQREVTVLKTGEPAYSWTVTNFNKPKKEDLIIYEVLIRDFDEDRNYQDLIDRIDYFKNLNVNAIELMPVMEFEGNESWGYNTAFHMALDKFYGTEEKLKELIDVCHQNGIAVILDVALNHAYGRNPMVRMWMNDPDNDGWGDPSTENPYFNTEAKHSYSVGSDFNHQSDLTQNYVKRVVKYWIQEFKIDGFRWDLTKGFTQNCNGNDEGCTNSYQADRVAILKEYADYSWSLDPDHYVIFEHLGGDNEEQEWANYRLNEGKGIMMWAELFDGYKNLGQGNSANINRIGHKAHGFSGKRTLGYPESHDKDRLMYEMIEFGRSNSNYDITQLDVALERMSALGAISFLVPGPKMMWHFGELGMDNSIFTCTDGTVNTDYDTAPGDCKLSIKPQPQWIENWLNNAARRQIYDDWSRFNELKIKEAVFEGDYSISSGSLTSRLEVFNSDLSNTILNHIVVLANFDIIERTVNTNFPSTGSWSDLMDPSGNTTYSASSITLPPGKFRVFGNQPATLSTDRFSSTDRFKIYPNPTNTVFHISQNVSEVSVFDLTGKTVKEFKGNFTPVTGFDVSDLGKSVYLIKMKGQNGEKSHAKLIKY